MSNSRRRLMLTTAHPVVNLMINLNKVEKARTHKKFPEFQRKEQQARYEAIFKGPRYQPMF